MKQKLIPLAIACLASGAAFAQTNVQIYGTVDVGFARRGDNVADNVGKQNAFNSGQSGTSLVGFKGVEDLGNGLKALFVLEAGFAADTGSHVDGDKLFNEQAFLGLTGNWGTAIAGRLVAPRHGFLSAIDPFGAGTVGQYRNVYNDVEFHRDAIDLVNDKAGLTGDDRYSALKLADVDRVDNAIAYVSPSFSGFNVTVAYATQAIGQEGNGISYGASTDNDGDAKVFTILPRYTNGPLDVGAVYQRIKVKEVLPGNSLGLDADAKLTQWAVGGSFDFKAVKLAAYYDKYKGKLAVDPINYSETETLKTWLVGVTVPFGKHAILASYSQSKFDDASSASASKAKQWAVGYTYALSKRTNFYAAISKINNDNEDGSTGNKVRRSADVADAANVGNGYQNGLQFGLKHSF